MVVKTHLAISLARQNNREQSGLVQGSWQKKIFQNNPSLSLRGRVCVFVFREFAEEHECVYACVVCVCVHVCVCACVYMCVCVCALLIELCAFLNVNLVLTMLYVRMSACVLSILMLRQMATIVLLALVSICGLAYPAHSKHPTCPLS